ncbi:Uncharacterised protein [Mycobacteroides abscessus subsp. abscessus]|nr:Uncharacterised protein [Mycobacteroides abscessus subsp. abscessus]
MEAEAPLTKVIKDCLDVLVDQIKKLVKSIAELVVKKFEESYTIKDWKGKLKFLAKKIPFAGTLAEIGTLANILRQVWNEATKLVDQVQKAVDLVKSVIEFFKDPAGYLKQKGSDALNKAVDGALDKAGIESDSGKQLAKDLPAAIVAAGDYAGAPDGGLPVAAGSTPWDDGN